MSDQLDLNERLLRTNDELFKLLKWAIDNGKLDVAAQLQPITSAFAHIFLEMGAKQSEVFKRRGKMKLVKKPRK